jgi:DNA-binding transcriptional ArsR family regulator
MSNEADLRRVRLDLGPLDRVRVSVMVSPYLSVLPALLDAVGGVRRGLPPDLGLAVSGAVDPHGRRAVAAMSQPQQLVPDCITPPFMFHADMTIAAAVEALRSTSTDLVAAQLFRELGPTPPPWWRAAMTQPEKWLASVADATLAAHAAMRPALDKAEPLIRRETERVGAAIVRGNLDVALATLNRRIRLDGQTLHYDHPLAGHHDLAGRQLVLVPIVAGARMLLTNVNVSDAVYIAYPVPGVGTLGARTVVPAKQSDRLGVLLGTTSARVLRHLEQALTMGELSRELGLAPSTTTAQCDRLELLGLLTRERRGREVRVVRTQRAMKLINVMTSP